MQLRFWMQGIHEPEITNLIKRIIKPDMKVADIGAAFGYHTLLLSKYAREVYAFEPEYGMFRTLTRNIELNKARNIVPLNLIIGDKFGFVDFYAILHGGTSSIFEDKNRTDAMKRPMLMVTLDDLAQDFDFIKIDAEGAELAILQGAPRTIKKPFKMTLELSHRWFRSRGEDPQDFLDGLKSFGIAYYALNQDGTPEKMSDADLIELARKRAHINLYAETQP